MARGRAPPGGRLVPESSSIDQLEIQRIDAEGLRLELPGDGVVVTIPVQPYSGSGPLPPLATLRHIVIAEPRGPSFEWHPGTGGFMRGTPRVDEITVPRLEAEVAGAFHGAVELHSDEISIGLVERGRSRSTSLTRAPG